MLNALPRGPVVGAGSKRVGHGQPQMMRQSRRVAVAPSRSSQPPTLLLIPRAGLRWSNSVETSASTPQAAGVSRRAGAAAASLLAAVWVMCGPAAALELEATEATFSMKCAGCHQGGGNVLAVGASLFPDDLKRNGMMDPQALFDLIYKGKGKMPGYGKDCAPKGACTFGPRLTDEQVTDLATYVLQKAEAGWPK